MLLSLLPVAVAASPKPTTASPRLCPPATIITNVVTICPIPFCDYQLEAGRRYVLRVRVMSNYTDAPWQRWNGYVLTCKADGVHRIALPVAAVQRAEYRLEEICNPPRVIPCLPSPVAQPAGTWVLLNGRVRPAL